MVFHLAFFHQYVLNSFQCLDIHQILLMPQYHNDIFAPNALFLEVYLAHQNKLIFHPTLPEWYQPHD